MKRGFLFANTGVLCLMLALMLLCPSSVKAQTDSTFVSMYWAVPTLYNPATAGADSALHVTAWGRKQWVGMDVAPQSVNISVDMPFMIGKMRSGLGISAKNDKAGGYKANLFTLHFSYSARLMGGRLALGVNVGKIEQTIKTTSEYSSQNVDLGIGAYYEKTFGKNHAYVGVSATHLNQPSLKNDTCINIQQKRTIYFLVGGNIPTRNPLFIIQPSLLFRNSGTATSVDFTLRATYNRRFWGGVSYRYDDAVTVMAGANIKSVRIGYAYDIGISSWSKSSKGSHEVMATYVMDINLDKKKRAPQKSIRLL